MISSTIEQQLTKWSTERFQTLFPDQDFLKINLSVTATTDETFGDYQCNAAMALAKIVKKSPRDVATAFIENANLPESVDRIEIAGPGFLNFFIKTAWLEKHLDRIQRDDRLGMPAVGQDRTVILDYSSPNIAKPMHIGHIRSTVIGNALDRFHRFLGYRVVADNHLGDWGTQFGILIMGYRHFLNADALNKDPIAELERLYVTSYDKAKNDETWMNQARHELVKLQQGDPDNLDLWKKFVDLSLREFQKIYERLDVSFDLTRGESHYNNRLSAIVHQLKQEKLLRESEGAQVVDLDDVKLPLCIVKKSDGAFNYATTDLATIQSRLEEFNPEKIIYVTDERQQLHFRQIFAIARKMGWKADLVHVWFGLMRLPEGTFSTRDGNVIKLERLLDEAEARALAIVKESSPDMDENQQRDVAKAVGLGAVKYADLSQSPQTLVTFSWDKALALDGNSAPYLQYAYARISSVQDKYNERFADKKPLNYPILLQEPVERTLALRLLRFPDVVIRAAETYRPNVLCDYLFDLAQIYSTFYQNIPFLKAEEGIRESRVRLCSLVAGTLQKGLSLLGIKAPGRI